MSDKPGEHTNKPGKYEPLNPSHRKPSQSNPGPNVNPNTSAATCLSGGSVTLNFPDLLVESLSVWWSDDMRAVYDHHFIRPAPTRSVVAAGGWDAAGDPSNWHNLTWPPKTRGTFSTPELNL